MRREINFFPAKFQCEKIITIFSFLTGEENLAILEEFIPSPEINGYRNKCEFTIGRHPETSQPIVGFRLASYK